MEDRVLTKDFPKITAHENLFQIVQEYHIILMFKINIQPCLSKLKDFGTKRDDVLVEGIKNPSKKTC